MKRTIIQDCNEVREGNEILIFYLFNTKVVDVISLYQAQKICSIDAWKDKSIQKIFDKNIVTTDEERRKENITITFMKSTEKNNYCYRTTPYEE